MQLSLATVFLGIAAVASALPQNNPIAARQNQGRPMPFGTCCVANTNLKQDACVADNGEAGRCVPGGNDCGPRLSCVAQSFLTCDDNVIERGKSLCRAQTPFGGLFDGANIIQDLSQATVN